MKVLINRVFKQIFKLYCYKFLLVLRSALNFRYLWLKNKIEISSFETLYSFRIVETSDLNLLVEFLVG